MQVRPTNVALSTSSGLSVAVPRVAHFGSSATIRRVRIYIVTIVDH